MVGALSFDNVQLLFIINCGEKKYGRQKRNMEQDLQITQR